MHPIAILVVAVLLVVVLIVRLKLNAFLALIAAAILIGLLSPQIPAGEVMKETGQRFGDLAASCRKGALREPGVLLATTG